MPRDNPVDHGSLRIGGVSLILGGVLILGNGLFPIPSDPLDYAGFLAIMLQHPARTRAAASAVPLGVWVLVVGIASIEQSLRQSVAASWARLGFHLFLVGTALVTVQYAFSNGALTLGIRGDDTAMFLLAAAGQVRSFGMLVLWLALLLVGISLLKSAPYPKWAGWSLLVISVAMVTVSGRIIVAGATLPTMAVSGFLGSVTDLWAIMLGTSILRTVHHRKHSNASRSQADQVDTQ